MNYRGTWSSTTSYATNDAVTFAGSTYLALGQNQNAEPDISGSAWTVVAQAGAMGLTGLPGATGQAATVAVGTVTTLPAGSSATVTNSGSANGAVLNFGIPQGAAGTAGASGTTGSGTASGTFAAMFHTVSFSTMYYAVNSSNASTSENGTTASTGVLAWVPLGCTTSALNVYSQQASTVTVTLRVGTPGAMQNSALACSAATNTSCTSSAAVTVAPGQFVDYLIEGPSHGTVPSGTPAAVWTALQCQ
jgi:hypothetical protein